MDVFALRERLIQDYGEYALSFINIADARVRALVQDELDSGLLWPRPLIQLNPAFESGGSVADLVARGLLHPACEQIFRRKEITDGVLHDGGPLRLHRHQTDAIEAASRGANYVLTTGTGSGKSLTYLIPAVDHVLKTGSGQGIKAIIVYPMNALANSQLGELDKYINLGFQEGKGPVTFARYTGQEKDEVRQRIMANPPDILLTNYVMMELILTRPAEADLISAARNLRFLVFDELHTYRGRQGADVALLARRIGAACGAEHILHVGTSATMASTVGSFDDQRQEVADVATKLFGAPVQPADVIGESLRRATQPVDLGDPSDVAALRVSVEATDPPPSSYANFVLDPLAGWIEQAFGLDVDRASGRLVRRRPRSVEGDDGAAAELSAATGVGHEKSVARIREYLLAGYAVRDPQTGFPAFAFRVHQFVSRGETVFATIESTELRTLATEGQRFVPGDRSKVYFPLVFCRECGQDYYPVWHRGPGAGFEERDLFDTSSEDGWKAGFLAVDPDQRLWKIDTEAVLERVPDDWIETRNGTRRLKRDLASKLPQAARVAADGTDDEGGADAWFVPAPFRFCLCCGVAYTARQRSDYAKLATLGSGGRSTATTILSLSVVRALRHDASLPEKARKLLSFTDNRQDASLQAGHFNDFIQTSLLRSALFAAASAEGPGGIGHAQLTQKVFEALSLDIRQYGANPQARYAARHAADQALRNVIGYRLYRDLARGWRISSPNLEQCGLLQIDYLSLSQLCATQADWQGCHPALANAASATREQISRVLLDHMRRELAIKVDFLKQQRQEEIQQDSSVQLISPWAFDDGERLEAATILLPRSERPSDRGGYFTYLSKFSGFAQYLRRPGVLPHVAARLSADETGAVIRDLLATLQVAGLVEPVMAGVDDEDVPGYQIPASAMVWKAGDGIRAHLDPIRVPRAPADGRRPNAFFVDFYRAIADDAKGLVAREHTAQVQAELREEREGAFREATLPVLFCSPTMELGVDIAELNAVNMRNVPPTPANYAQRGGRAGRSGQPALVFTYCSTGSPHDQYFFRRQDDMVAGQVAPPRIDLTNEDLLRAHLHAIWLSETGVSLGGSLSDVLDLTPGSALQVVEHLKTQMEAPVVAVRATARAQVLLDSIGPELNTAPWFDPEWRDRVIGGAFRAFGEACERWRGLYRAAHEQRDRQHQIIGDASKGSREKKEARRLRAEADSQLALLTAEAGANATQSDFYSYRYFASEGFLPGYSFPRLPLSAYIPGSKRPGQEGEFVSRPRFLAVSEFGPRSFIYHEGSRYLVSRVMMPPDQRQQDGGGPSLATITVKQCSSCGYLHRPTAGLTTDTCERCAAPSLEAIDDLFRLQNVATIRRDRISSDEEERTRQGYDIRTGVRFTMRHGELDVRTAVAQAGGEPLATLTFGDSAEIWRMNLGWRRRTRNGYRGFKVDPQSGTWAKDDAAGGAQDAAGDDDLAQPHGVTVIPYVEDRKNALLIEFAEEHDASVLASLQAALRRAICVVYQLEDLELAAEPLPSMSDRRLLLLFESAEGGAGVLRRLVDDPGQLGVVAAAALELCHYDTATGEDLGRAPSGRYLCEAACYDCLMSYSNQPDHPLLDRKAIKDVLTQLHAAHVSASPGRKSREEQLAELRARAGSGLERAWLEFVDVQDLALPSHSQSAISECHARPDFFYDRHQAAIFIDGPHHEAASQAERDAAKRRCLEDLGYTVIAFGSDQDAWPAVFARFPSVFGIPS